MRKPKQAKLTKAKKLLASQHRKFKGRGGHNYKGKPVKRGINAEA